MLRNSFRHIPSCSEFACSWTNHSICLTFHVSHCKLTNFTNVRCVMSYDWYLRDLMNSTYVVARRNEFMGRCQVSGDVVGGLLFTWTVMVLHDAYFFFVHTLMHYFKSAYRMVHQWHHATNGDLTVFNTAYGDILDIALTFAPFYAALVAYIYCQPSWNPLHVAFLMWAVNGVDMMGHCGFRLPIWVYVPGSLGVLLTPLAQRPKHHYIHHLDPRYNRSLYFTWWDRLAGSFRESHPKVVNDDKSSIAETRKQVEVVCFETANGGGFFKQD